jgi:predicted dithiol-disulfide oxidoreductase (DUF899 family)
MPSVAKNGLSDGAFRYSELMTTSTDRISELEQQLFKLKQELTELRKAELGQVVEDHELTRLDGSKVRLSELFGDKSDLLTVHNMGKGCNYCTLWADGFVAQAPMIMQRCAFVLVSADDPATAKSFSESRGWNYPVVSGKGSTFTEAMGFLVDGNVWPGVTSFHKTPDGVIHRVSKSFFGPGDDFCPIWAFFDLLKDGANGWEPEGESTACSGS